MSSIYTQPPAEKPKAPLYKRKGFWIGVAVLVVVGSVANAVDGHSGKDTDAKPKPAVTVTETATPAAPATPAEEEPSAPAAEETPAAAVEPATENGDLPDMVGMSHQAAQDAAQAAGFFNLREEDASGADRMLLWDRNWKVCRQEPAPGSNALEKTITLYSVKTDESC